MCLVEVRMKKRRYVKRISLHLRAIVLPLHMYSWESSYAWKLPSDSMCNFLFQIGKKIHVWHFYLFHRTTVEFQFSIHSWDATEKEGHITLWDCGCEKIKQTECLPIRAQSYNFLNCTQWFYSPFWWVIIRTTHREYLSRLKP